MITVNNKTIKDLKPCAERYKNWLEHYQYWSGSFADFLDLDKISYEDKVWVSKKLLSIDELTKWSILCAESVLPIFEARYPDDKRPRECVEYLKSGGTDTVKLTDLRCNAYAAKANAADADAAAAYVAYAAYAAATYAAYAAATYAVAAAAAAAAAENQRSLNLEFLKQVIMKQGDE